MAITVTGVTTITTAETGTWVDVGGGGGSSFNTDVVRQGSNSRARKVSNGVKGYLFDNGSGIDITGQMVAVWVNVTGGVGSLDTLANGGIRIRIASASGTGNYAEWYVAGNDTYGGGWVKFVIDVSKTASATGGTGLSMTTARYFGVIFDMTASVGGGDPNTYVDAIHRWDDVVVTGTSTSLCADLVAADDTNGWGIFRDEGGITYSKALIILGGTSATDVSDEGCVLVFEDPQYHNGTSVVSALTASKIGLKADRTVINATDITFGTKVGSVGVDGAIFLSAGLAYVFDASDTDLDSFELYGCLVKGAGDPTFGDSACEILSSTFDTCGQIDPGSASFRESFFISSTSTTGAVLWSDSADVEDCSWINNAKGILIDTVPTGGTDEFTGHSYSGNTKDVRNDSGGAVTIDVLGGGATPTVENITTSTTTVNNPTTYKLTGLDAGSQITIAKTSDRTVLSQGNPTAGVYTYTYNHTADTAVDVMILDLDKRAVEYADTLTAADRELPITQADDLVFENPT